MPIGSVYASLQLILPNQVRGQIGALQVFTLNLFGLILGPALPGVLNDYVFRDGQMIGSLARAHRRDRVARVGAAVPGHLAPVSARLRA